MNITNEIIEAIVKNILDYWENNYLTVNNSFTFNENSFTIAFEVENMVKDHHPTLNTATIQKENAPNQYVHYEAKITLEVKNMEQPK